MPATKCTIEAVVNGEVKSFVGVICDICQGKISPPGALRKHMASHEKHEEVILECKECGDDFTIKNPGGAQGPDSHLFPKICPSCRGKKAIGSHKRHA